MGLKVSKSESKGPILAGPHLTSCNPLPVERWLGARGRQESGRERRGQGRKQAEMAKWHVCLCWGPWVHR